MTVQIAENLTIRAATMDDAEVVAELANQCSMLEEGTPITTPDETRRHWSRPKFDLAANVFLAFTPEGQLVGEGWVSHMAPHVNIWSGVRVHPDFRSQGIGSELLARTEARADEIMALAPPNARVTIKRERFHTNKSARSLLLKHGYESTRHYWRMLIELDTEPPEPVFPAEVRVRTTQLPDELRSVALAVDDIFKDHYGHTPVPEDDMMKNWQHWIDTGDDVDPSLWFLAVADGPDGEEIAGLSICLPKLTGEPGMGYVEILGIRRAWRRKGIALALLHHSFRTFRGLGKARCTLHVDAASLTGATRLYEKAGMHVDHQYEEFTKELRPGDDLTTQTLAE